MSLSQKRRRRVEVLIDQRLVGFLKPQMSVTSGPVKPQPQRKTTSRPRLDTQAAEERAS